MQSALVVRNPQGAEGDVYTRRLAHAQLSVRPLPTHCRVVSGAKGTATDRHTFYCCKDRVRYCHGSGSHTFVGNIVIESLTHSASDNKRITGCRDQIRSLPRHPVDEKILVSVGRCGSGYSRIFIRRGLKTGIIICSINLEQTVVRDVILQTLKI